MSSHTLPRASASGGALAAASTVVELDAEGFYPYLENAGSSLVVVDYFTDRCGPCKIFAPRYEEMAQEYKVKGVAFVKFDCSGGPKAALAMKLNIKQLPTFHVYRGSEQQAVVLGAREAELRTAIDQLLPPSAEQ